MHGCLRERYSSPSLAIISSLFASTTRCSNGANAACDSILYGPKLRSLYLQFVNTCFTHTMAVNFLGKRILGHFDESESLRYVSTRIDGMDALKGSFGPLDLSLPPP